MSADKRWRLVCYDIRDPARWRNVYRIVRGAGTRVQYSVFRCRLDDKELAKLRWELARVMDAVDSLLVVDLCPRCAGNVISQNHVEGWTDPPATFRVISKAARSHAAPIGNLYSDPSSLPAPPAPESDQPSGHEGAAGPHRIPAGEFPLARSDFPDHTATIPVADDPAEQGVPVAIVHATTTAPAPPAEEQISDQVPTNVLPLLPKPSR
jgi:CRISPR-associated protein Cas2